jgi:hypothetical protein
VLGALSVVALPTQLRTKWSGLDCLVIAYLALGTLLPLADLFLVSGRPLDNVAIQTFMGPVQFALLYLLVSTCFREDRTQILAQRTLLLASLPISLMGILEALAPPAFHEFLTSLTGTTAFNTQGYDSVPRAASLFPVWLALAGYLLVILILATELLLVGNRDVLSTWALGLVIGLGLLALAASLTVTISVVYAVTALYLGWRHRKLAVVLTMIGLVVIAAQFVFGGLIEQRTQAQTVSTTVERTGPSWLPETIGYRVKVWEDQYAEALGAYAATGYGPGFPSGVDWSHTESGYITILLRGGVPYLAGTAALLAGVVVRARRNAAGTSSSARSALCVAAGAVAIVQLPINLTFPYFTASGLPQAAWILWGLLAAQELSDDRKAIIAPGTNPNEAAKWK